MIYLYLAISILVNAALLYTTINLLLKTETQEDTIDKQGTIIDGLYNAAKRAYADIKALDVSGAFEVDDEVGAIFESIKSAIEEFAAFAGVEVVEEEEETNEEEN